MQPKANALTINAVLALSLTALLTACSHPSSDESPSSSASSGSGSVLGSLRPKADPKILQRLKAQHMVSQPLGGSDESATANQGSGLPVVSSAPFAPPADQVASTNQQAASAPALPFFPFMAPQSAPGANSGSPSSPGSVPPSPAAAYGGYGSSVPPPPPGPGGLVPPPPAVSLSTQAQTVPYGAPPEAYMNPYANPYMNPYSNPYAGGGNPYAQGGEQARPAGSPFASGGAMPAGGAEETKPRKKLQDFTPITPTGMEARSTVKQREDLKSLLKGALSMSPQLQSVSRDKDIALSLSKIDVGMPQESTKGSISLSSRQIEQLYRSPVLDKKIAGSVRKIMSDVAQDYYRYLYAYNKFALAQQTVAARKQETEVAESAAEQQRAAADMSQAQQGAESARDDLKVAQNEMAATAGAQAARTVIARVSGVAPSIDSLAQAERQALTQARNDMSAGSSGGGGILGLLGFGSKHTEEVQELNAQPKALSAPPQANKKAEGKKPEAAKKTKTATKQLPGDLVQAPAVAAKPAAQPVVDLRPAAGDSIAFELRNLNVTPRKSILKVAIRNTGSENLTFDPDAISIMENNRKLSDAAVRADFETTLVAPSKEVSGTITIFGHPWNDRISVFISDAGGKNIPLRR